MTFVRSGGLYVPSRFGGPRRLGAVALPPGNASTVQLPTWAPTSEAELDQWVAEQTDVWDRPDVKAALSDTKSRIERELQPTVAPSGQTMDEYAIASWASADVMDNGFPTSADEAAAMTQRFLDAQGASMGFHPGFVGAGVELITSGWPENAEDAADWGRLVADNIAQQYGLSMPSDWDAKGVVTAASSAACLQAGVPFVGVVTTSIDALWDGTLTYDEIGSIVVAVGAAVGAAVGQMFGIPAPIGAFVGAITTELLYGVVADFFGWGPSDAEKRGRAWDAMQQARTAMMAQCLSVGTQAWNQYNDYWNALIGDFEVALNEQAPLLGAGLRAFGSKQVNYVVDKDGNEQVLFRPIYRKCTNTSGCLYYGTYGDQPFGFERVPPASAARINEVPDAVLGIRPVPNFSGAMRPDGTIDPYSALAYYGASRYVTPYQALLELYGYDNQYVKPMGGPCWAGGSTSGAYTECWEAVPHSDQDYLEHLSYIRSAPSPGELGTCKVPAWSVYMMDSLVQVGPASAFVMNDAAATISANAAKDEVARRMDVALDDFTAVRQVVVQAAQERRDILRMRRAQASASARLNYGLLAAGTGGLAGWLAAKILGSR